MDLFDDAGMEPEGIPSDAKAPLAVRMRPRGVDDVLGQDHLLTPGSPLRRLIDAHSGDSGPSSVILWGPPGTGKTTLSYLIARTGSRKFVELSAVSAGVKDLRAVISEARRHLTTSGAETVLFIDEVHRFSKTQQDALLPAVENRWVILVAATTENPSFSIVTPLLSRSIMLTLHGLGPEHVGQLLERAVADERGLAGRYSLLPESKDMIVRLAGSDARRSLTVLEAAAATTAARQDTAITVEDVSEAIDVAAMSYDRDGDAHYDVISAFIKSIRGSNVDAAMHYLARMLEAGEDPRFVARRLMISAAEDVGMADPSALQTATAAAQSVALVGMPEARIILAEAVVHLATAPKSNAAYNAINAAIADVKAGKIGTIPNHLRDGSVWASRQTGAGEGYRYAHDYPGHIVTQQYLPDELAGTRYYEPTENGYEAQITPRLAKYRSIVDGEQ
ncbi:replication-associated recombination protein A [Flaviflexus equikiangi]|uniref:Replication-associated recombination protein A n=1 Tax=Flaviflexus equikiangi TaxID=2758573 RepID=A0ABS2THS5_9ACTO|nr:replication-associated recombination protein A [Flaviflexus equikiangi]MBM9434210.1 replication-associated recombination protein A [Flaviflexus equikiangi]